MIRFKCPNCETILQIGREYAGQSVLCSTCNTQLIAPEMSAPEPSPDKACRDMILCVCGQCKSIFKVPVASSGRQVSCPKCGHAAHIPDQEQAVSEADTLRFACPDCEQSYCVLAKYAGKKFKCLVCKQPCAIPQPILPSQNRNQIVLDEEKSSSPPIRPAQKTFQPPKKSRTFSFKIITAVLAAVIGFAAGFIVVYMLLNPHKRSFRTPPIQTAQPSQVEE